MGWEVKIKTENGVTKYRIWTNNNDGWITDWSTKEEITKFFFWHRLYDFMDRFIEDSMTFPNKYMDKDTGSIIMDSTVQSEFNEFITNKCNQEGESFTEITTDKFAEILSAHGLELKVKDKRGYSFNSKD